eukprot:scaffold704_cov347-Prasinococcus_capsulatus_cf.AAC.22
MQRGLDVLRERQASYRMSPLKAASQVASNVLARGGLHASQMMTALPSLRLGVVVLANDAGVAGKREDGSCVALWSELGMM